MNTAKAIQEVYVDHVGLEDLEGKKDRRNADEALSILVEKLGTYAIGQAATPQEADAMVILGGDGSFLHAIRRHGFPDIPMTGINTGTLGFFMDTLPTEEDIDAMTQRLASGRYATKCLPLLELPLWHGESSEYAINDVVIRHKTTQSFKAALRLGYGVFDHFVGDGFIFATPQGSTGYSMAAGGPILQEDIDAFVVTPSNPHPSNHYRSLERPAIVSADKDAMVVVRETEKRPFSIDVDGNNIDWPQEEDEIRVKIADDKRLQIVRFSNFDYFQHTSAAFRGKQSIQE